MRIVTFLASAAALGAVAAPAAAQYYPQQYQQAYPQYQQAYPQQYQQAYPGYGQQPYAQGYAQNPVGQIIDSLLGNRYNVTDRQAVSQCASAAMAQAGQQYGGGYNRGALRVTSITDVQRRSNGLRVSGMMSSGGGYDRQRGYQNGYQNRDYARGDVSFRCNVAYNGAVTGVRIGRYNGYRG
jgi:hypothetical protein